VYKRLEEIRIRQSRDAEKVVSREAGKQ
jgi:hypothetical protein